MSFRSLLVLLTLSMLIGCNQSTPPASGKATPAPQPAVAEPPAQTPGTAPAATPTAPAEQPAAAAPGKAIDVRTIVEAAQNGKMDEAVKLAEQALAGDPNNPEAMLIYTQVAQIKAQELAASDRAKANEMFLKVAEVMRKYAATKKELDPQEQQLLAGAIYNEACALATDKQTDKAIVALREALKAGFSNAENLKTDADFESLRANPEFQKLLEEVVAKAAAEAKEQAVKDMAEQKPFDFSFELPDLNGKPVSLSGLKGKVVIADIWGTWCPPCRMEIPHFVKLYETYQKDGLEVVGLNYERVPENERLETIKKFVDANNVKYPCVIGDDATRDKVPDFQGFPTTIIIDRNGVVRLKAVGYHPYEFLEAVVKILLEEPVKPQS
jgi:thiol-disulfide isomerase/thioredoxin